MKQKRGSRVPRPQGTRDWLWAVFLLILALTGCTRIGEELPDVAVDLAIEPTPPRMGPATVTVRLRNAEGQPIAGSKVELEGNMKHAGMVPVSARATEVAPGQYEARLEFTMAGDWFILVRADLPDGRSLERSIDVPGVDATGGDTPMP